MTVKGSNRIVVNDIQVGDVWIFAGQSNMNMPLGATDFKGAGCTEEVEKKLRVFRYATTGNSASEKSFGSWSVPGRQRATDLPAIPLLFGRALVQNKGVPVGAILAGCDGAPLETFMSPETIVKTHNSELKLCSPHVLTGNFKSRFAPILRLNVRGIAWYQGESNLLASSAYKSELTEFIRDIRAKMNASSLPFLIVQLPNFGHRRPDNDPTDSFWADMRESQFAATALKNVYIIVAIDTVAGSAPDLHPKEKTVIAERLANVAMKLMDGKPVSNPMFQSQRIDGDSIFLTFKNLEGPLKSKDGKNLRGFQLAAADGKFHWADAEICGSEIKVTSDEVVVPAAVRYAWADNPDCNLCCEDMPVSPFRTDNWVTKPKLDALAFPAVGSR
jgi:sialate O-acetylesterase